jgi:hypothetical protein
MNSSAESVITLVFAVMTIVLPGEADVAIGELEQTAADDGDAVSVAPEITEHLLRSSKLRRSLR